MFYRVFFFLRVNTTDVGRRVPLVTRRPSFLFFPFFSCFFFSSLHLVIFGKPPSPNTHTHKNPTDKPAPIQPDRTSRAVADVNQLPPLLRLNTAGKQRAAKLGRTTTNIDNEEETPVNKSAQVFSLYVFFCLNRKSPPQQKKKLVKAPLQTGKYLFAIKTKRNFSVNETRSN